MHYIIGMLADSDVTITKPAQSVPIGDMDYLDDGTLIATMRLRCEM